MNILKNKLSIGILAATAVALPSIAVISCSKKIHHSVFFKSATMNDFLSVGGELKKSIDNFNKASTEKDKIIKYSDFSNMFSSDLPKYINNIEISLDLNKRIMTITRTNSDKTKTDIKYKLKEGKTLGFIDKKIAQDFEGNQFDREIVDEGSNIYHVAISKTQDKKKIIEKLKKCMHKDDQKCILFKESEKFDLSKPGNDSFYTIEEYDKTDEKHEHLIDSLKLNIAVVPKLLWDISDKEEVYTKDKKIYQYIDNISHWKTGGTEYNSQFANSEPYTNTESHVYLFSSKPKVIDDAGSETYSFADIPSKSPSTEFWEPTAPWWGTIKYNGTDLKPGGFFHDYNNDHTSDSENQINRIIEFNNAKGQIFIAPVTPYQNGFNKITSLIKNFSK